MALKDQKRQANIAAFRRLIALVGCLLLLVGIGVSAFAVTQLDPLRGTELTVVLDYGGTPIPEAEFSLYRVGSIDANAEITPEEPFIGRFDVSDSRSRDEWDQLAAEMASFCRSEKLAPIAGGLTNGSGSVTFGSGSTLASGLYLVIGDEVLYRDYTYTSLPFLVSLPSWNVETSSWEYVVRASPKLDRESNTPTPTQSPKPSPIPTPTPTNPKLPQTGQLWWPVPVLLFAGLAMIVLGLVQKKRV